MSIGLALTLRYTAAVTVTVVGVAFVLYLQVVQRINREAQLLIQIHADELSEQLRESRGVPLEDRLDTIREQVERFVRSSDEDLGVAVEVISQSGETLLHQGIRRAGLPTVSPAVLEGQTTEVLRAVNTGGEHALLVLEVSIPSGALRLMMDTARYAKNVQEIRAIFLVALPVVLILTAALGWLLARSSLRPISQILAAAQRISGPPLDEQVPESGSGDELDQLAKTLNGMLHRLRGAMQQMQRFNANAAHQLRTPLTVISGQIEVALTKPRSAAEYERVIRKLRDRVREVSAGVSAMLHLSQIEAGVPQDQRAAVRIQSVLETVVDFFSLPAAEKDIQLIFERPLPDVCVAGQAQWLHELFSNLIANAITHSPSGGEVLVSGRLESRMLVIEIADTGPGISPDARRRVFDRFERATLGSAGFGLGLPIAQEIAYAHGGEITVLDGDAPGTCMAVRLPYLDSAHGAELPREREPQRP